MKRLLIISALLLFTTAVQAACPFTVRCSLDGENMLQEECNYNGSHKTCQFGHYHMGPKGKQRHVTNVQCD